MGSLLWLLGKEEKVRGRGGSSRPRACGRSQPRGGCPLRILRLWRMALSLLWILLALLPRILLGLKFRLSQGLRADIACELPIIVVQLFNTKLKSFCKKGAIVIHQWQRMI